MTFSTSKTIMCSAGKGELTQEDCLACALSAGHPDCGYDYSLLRKLFEGSDRSGIHVSDLTGCIKNAYLKKVEHVPEYPHEMLARTLGTMIHSGLEGGNEHAESEVVVDAAGIVGCTDLVYKNGRVLDWKSTRWIFLDKLPYSSHSLQVNLYAYLLEEMGRRVTSLAIQYIDLSGPTRCRSCRLTVRYQDGNLACPKCGSTPKNAHLGAVLVEVPRMDRRYLERMIDERRTALQNALDMGIEPFGEPSYLCGYCAYRERCPQAQDAKE